MSDGPTETERARPVFGFLLQTAGVVLGWLALYKLNDLLFPAAEIDPFVSWIFLPAAIRVLAVMVFGPAGVIGLFIGSYLTIEPEVQENMVHAGMISLVSAVAPLIAVRFCQTRLALPDTLAGLRPRNLFCFSLAGAVLNVGLHQIVCSSTPAGTLAAASCPCLWAISSARRSCCSWLRRWCASPIA